MVNIKDPISRGIKFFRSPGIIVLGAPVGTVTFEKEALEARILSVEKILDLLPNLEDPHGEYCLLRSCFSLPKITFSLRTIDPSNHMDILARFDYAIGKSIETTLGAPLPYPQQIQTSYPVSMGGMGIRKAVEHALFLTTTIKS